MTIAPASPLDGLIRWSRRHVLLVDGWWALVWTAAGLLWQPVADTTPREDALWVVLVLAIGGPLVLRRTRPRLAIGLLALTLVVHVLVLPLYTAAAAIGACAAAYTAHALLRRRERILVTVALAAGTAWAALAYPAEILDLRWFQRWPVIGVQWLVVAVFCLIGALARKRREEFTHAVERAQLIEQQQAQEVRLATLAERTHIAREMHDIVAHSLGVIIAQADGGRYAAAGDPAAAAQS
ncbi:MAG: histidine kinase dimerization/phosphoacceptor domain-containing protein, partial [Propionibacteriaceae bacterium]|nr:histidine kinase dimerization/phosphoacceptor domain-containing protein [Propionibacteriaceae bacterium]